MSENNALERIEDIDVTSEMETSFLEYAYSVIYSRALPDARDGLKPVQRRILFMMTQMGLVPEKGHVKSARVVGEVMGKLHPHGDSSIYDALVRLAQPFSMRLPLVDGHGNFGSLDDGPAASRYTEARLAGPAIPMTADLAEDVVNFVPNYDNQFQQPEVLPALIPNLLVNGASGIAVGMATNLAPHNLTEVLEGAKHLLFNPDATTDDLMFYIPGPDLPGGGTIVGLEGVKDAYNTGRGKFLTRAKVSVEKVSARRSGLIITELPFLVGPERIIERVKQGVETKKISGISDIQDLTDRKNGLRVVITLKTGFSPEAVLEQLYRATPLEDSFSINSVALVNGEPKTLGLKDMLRVFLDHRIEVVTRRSKFRLQKRQERLHLVEGLLLAILDIDSVIQIVRASDDATVAKERLITAFELSNLQAEYILELRLRRLTKFSRIELETEKEDLLQQISELEALLSDTTLLYKKISDEFTEVQEKFGTPRRTLLMGAVARPTRAKEQKSLQISDDPCRVLLSTSGKLIRTPITEENSEVRIHSRSKNAGAVSSVLQTTARATIGALLSTGEVVKFTPVDLPEAPAASVSFEAGVSALSYIAMTEEKVRVVGLVDLASEKPLAMFTRFGTIKRALLNDLPNRDRFEIITLKKNDELIASGHADDDSEVVFITSQAQLLRYSSALVRPQGRLAGGMAGISLKGNSTVIYARVIAKLDNTFVFTAASSSNALPGTGFVSLKKTPLDEFPPKGRATGGVRAQRFLKDEDVLVAAWVGNEDPVLIEEGNKVREAQIEAAKRDASGTALDWTISAIGEQP